jgi:pimeloyl-ACP methyl ester carboxylesterase
MKDAAATVEARAAGLVVVTEAGELELLCATSHAASEVELYQLQQDAGPCYEAATHGTPVALGGQDMVARWGDVGRAILAAGFTSVHAFPIHWYGHRLGALGLFHAGVPDPEDAALMVVGQAFADVASLVIVAPPDLSPADLQDRKHEALAGRVVIERAKGAIAYRENLTTEAAYPRLHELAAERGLTLTEMAGRILHAATNGLQAP